VFKESDVVAALKKASKDGVDLQNIRSLPALSAGQRRDLLGMSSNSRHRWLSFPRRRLDGGPSLQFDVVPASPHFLATRSGAAIFLMSLRDGRRPDYSRGFSGRRNCAAVPNSQEPNMTMAGVRIAIAKPMPRQ